MANPREFPDRSVWQRKVIGVLEPIRSTSAIRGDPTFKAVVNLRGFIDSLDLAEVEAAGFQTGQVDIVVHLHGSAYTRSISDGWRLVIDGDTWIVKRRDIPGQYEILLYAIRHDVGSAD